MNELTFKMWSFIWNSGGLASSDAQSTMMERKTPETNKGSVRKEEGKYEATNHGSYKGKMYRP